MDGQPASKITGPPLVEIGYARVMCAGILLKGSGLSVRRVRVTNFGTRTSSQECFPLYLQSSGGPLPLTNVIEDCIIESPGWHNARETTCIQGPIERNNLVRCDLRKPGPYPPIAFESMVYDSSTGKVTFTTRQPHQLTTSDRIIISGATPEGFNGAWDLDYAQRRTLQCTVGTGLSNPVGTIVLEQASKPTLAIKTVAYDNGPPKTVTLTLKAKHYRAVDDWIVVTGILENGILSNVFNGAFKVTYASGDVLKYELYTAQTPAAPTVIEGYLDQVPTSPVFLEGITVNGADGTVLLRSPHYRPKGSYVRLDGRIMAGRMMK